MVVIKWFLSLLMCINDWVFRNNTVCKEASTPTFSALYLLCIYCMLPHMVQCDWHGWQYGDYWLFYFCPNKSSDSHGNYLTIPGWHNGRKATKRIRTRCPSFAVAVFKHSVNPPSRSQSCLKEKRHSLDMLAKECLFQEFQSTIHDCRHRILEWAKQTAGFSKMLHRCARLLTPSIFVWLLFPLFRPACYRMDNVGVKMIIDKEGVQMTATNQVYILLC